MFKCGRPRIEVDMCLQKNVTQSVRVVGFLYRPNFNVTFKTDSQNCSRVGIISSVGSKSFRIKTVSDRL